MTTDDTQNLLEHWIKHRFLLTEAKEEDFPIFDSKFRSEVADIQKDFGVDPVTDGTTLVDDEEPDSGTCRESVEKYSDLMFQSYLSARSKGHGIEFSAAYADEWILNDEEEMSSLAYRTIAEKSRWGPQNPAYMEAREMCLHLKNDDVYASICANWLCDFDYSFRRANEVTIAELRALDVAQKRNYSPLRSRMYVDALGPKFSWLEEPLAELLARIFEEEVAAGRTEWNAERYAEFYTDSFGPDGIFELDEEELSAEYAMIKAEAMCRYRGEDGAKDMFVFVFEQVNRTVPHDPAQDRFSRFDMVEEKLRREWYLAAPEPPATTPGWRMRRPHQRDNET